MKVLILSCSTGGGHNSCGHYIEEELKDIDVNFEETPTSDLSAEIEKETTVDNWDSNSLFNDFDDFE